MDRKRYVVGTYKIKKTKTQKQLKENGCCIAIKDSAVSKIKSLVLIGFFLIACPHCYVHIYLYIYIYILFISFHPVIVHIK